MLVDSLYIDSSNKLMVEKLEKLEKEFKKGLIMISKDDIVLSPVHRDTLVERLPCDPVVYTNENECRQCARMLNVRRKRRGQRVVNFIYVPISYYVMLFKSIVFKK